MVLLKNDGVLPLDKDIKSLGIIGPNAKKSQIIGGGSAHLKAYYESHPLDAFEENLGANTKIVHSKGCHTYKYYPALDEELIKNNSDKENGYLIEYFDHARNSKDPIHVEYGNGSKFWVFEGFAKEIIAKQERPDIYVKFTCTYVPDISGFHDFELFAIGKSKLLIDDNLVVDNWSQVKQGDAFFAFASSPVKGGADLVKNQEYRIEIQYKFEGNFPAIYIGCKTPDKIDLFAQAKKIAEESDQTILVVGTNSDWETEGNDRTDLELPGNQNALIDAILEIDPNAILVLNSGSPIRMPWINKAKAVLQCWYPGQEFGNALFDIVMGIPTLRGRLPTSFPKKLEDTPAFKFYPGKDLQMNYEEDLLVGYKWYQRQNIATLYPFGYGLSYTSFEYFNLDISEIDDCTYRCTFSIKNTGKVDGSEVAQCYVGSDNANLNEPIKNSQGFDKVFIESGKEKTIEIILNKRNFVQWDTATKNWEISAGNYEISIGASVDDIRLSGFISL